MKLLFAALHESLVGTKRRFAGCKAMSEVGGKADLPVERPDFSVGPGPEVRNEAISYARGT
jgi:hypothetical protein